MTLARSSGLNAVTTPRNTVFPFAKSVAKIRRKTGTRKAKKKKKKNCPAPTAVAGLTKEKTTVSLVILTSTVSTNRPQDPKKKKENATAVKRIWMKTNTSSALPEAMKKKRCAECAVMILTKK